MSIIKVCFFFSFSVFFFSGSHSFSVLVVGPSRMKNKRLV
jgi:hypothetical protein